MPKPLRTFILIVCLIFPLAIVCGLYRFNRNWKESADLTSQPPQTVFKRVFGIPPPAGVTGIVAAGYAPFNGEVWMRFHADDVSSVLQALKDNPVRPLLGPDEEYDDWQLHPELQVYKERREYLRMVGWEGTKHVTSPEFYRFPLHPQSGWGGNILVDRRRKLFFVGATVY